VLEELDAEQYKHFLFLVVALRREVIDADEFRVQWLSRLLGMRVKFTDYRKEVTEELMGQLDALDGYYENGELRLSTGMNLLPAFNGWKARVGDMLNGLTFGDFVECLDALGVINESEDDSAREAAFNEITCKLYVREAEGDESVPVLLAVHAVTLVVSVFNMLTKEPIEIAGKPIDFGIIFRPVPGVPTRANDNTGWHGMAIEVATGGVFGTLKQVNETPMWDVLLYLYRCKFELMHDKTRRSKK